MKSTCRVFIHISNIYCLIWIQDIFSAVINTIKTKNLLKLWIRIQQYTATDFQGWSKMTLKIKTAYFSTFRSGIRKIIWQPYYNYIGKLRMIKWNRFDTDNKNESAIFTRWISFTGSLWLECSPALRMKVYLVLKLLQNGIFAILFYTNLDFQTF